MVKTRGRPPDALEWAAEWATERAALLRHCAIPTPEAAERNSFGLELPPRRLFPALILPELRAILYPVAKCASTILAEFFANGPKPLFRIANESDGVGSTYGHFVRDLGETEASRRMKREFYSFAFVCHPVKRLVSAYGTINKRTEGGYALINGRHPALFWPPFARIQRGSEPRRFAQFVQDLTSLRLATVEVVPYASASWNHSLRAVTRALVRDSRSALTPLSIHNLSHSKTALDKKLRGRITSFARLSEGYQNGEASALYEVENSMVTEWAHAHSQRSLLNMTDSDGVERRLDFLGRVESLTSDLRAVLRALNVSDDQLSNKQLALLDGNASSSSTDTKLFSNSREGFRGLPSTRYRIAALVTGEQSFKDCDNTTKRRIIERYEADFKCLGYEWPKSGGMRELFGYS